MMQHITHRAPIVDTDKSLDYYSITEGLVKALFELDLKIMIQGP